MKWMYSAIIGLGLCVCLILLFSRLPQKAEIRDHREGEAVVDQNQTVTLDLSQTVKEERVDQNESSEPASVVAQLMRDSKEDFPGHTVLLMESLKKHGMSEDLRKQLLQMCDSPIDAYIRDGIIQAIIFSGVKGSAKFAVEVYSKFNDQASRDGIIQNLHQLGSQFRFDGGEDLTEELSGILVSDKLDSKLIAPLTASLASYGKPEGIDLLFGMITSRVHSAAELERSEDVYVASAFNALERIYSDESADLMSRKLVGYSDENLNIVLAGKVLSKMSNGKATSILLQWAGGAPDMWEPVVSEWLGSLTDSESYELMTDASRDPNWSKSKPIKDALQAIVKANEPVSETQGSK